MAKPKIVDEVIEARPVNPNRDRLMNRPIGSRMPRNGVAPVDINAARDFAADMVKDGDYKNPQYKGKLQEMFPPVKYRLGGIVKKKKGKC